MIQNRPQIDKFREAARELESDESTESFERTLEKLVKSSPEPVCPECGFSPKTTTNGYDYTGLQELCKGEKTGSVLRCKHLEGAINFDKSL